MISVSITGAAGFLGSYLTAHLKTKDITVFPVSRRQLSGIYHVEDYSETPGKDVLIHLAEESDRGKVNSLGKSYLENSARVVKVLSERFPKIIYASSGIVYGGKNESSCKVGMPVFGSDIYSRSKIINEQIVLEAGGCVARLSNLFGIGMSTNNVLSDIIDQVPGVGPLRVRDDTPIRDFLPVSDSCSALGHMVDENYNGIVNVGSGVGISINNLAKQVLSLAGEKNREVVVTKPSKERSKIVLDISETLKNIGWAPSFNLKNQLEQLIAIEH
jgi:UDP-glucose 4-epimerase